MPIIEPIKPDPSKPNKHKPDKDKHNKEKPENDRLENDRPAKHKVLKGIAQAVALGVAVSLVLAFVTERVASQG